MKSKFPRRIFVSVALGAVVFLVGLAVVNVADYRRFQFAISTGERLGPEGLQQLALVCSETEVRGHQRYEHGDWPEAFAPLRPVRVSLYPGSSDITLYRTDDSDYGVYVFLRIETSPHNQAIRCVSNLNGPQKSPTLWIRDPEFERSLEPEGRLATVTANSNLSDWTEWIVLSNEIMVVENSGTVGAEGHVVARAVPTSSQMMDIESALAAIGPEIRGHAFEAPVFDGYSLDITFTADGSRGDAIRLHNTWRPEVKPLLDAISTALPPDHRIPFEARMLRRDHAVPEEYIRKSTWAEVDRRETPILPWWCLWPRFVGH